MRLWTGFRFSKDWSAVDAINNLSSLRRLVEELEHFGTLVDGFPTLDEDQSFQKIRDALQSNIPSASRETIELWLRRILDARHIWSWQYTNEDITHFFGDQEECPAALCSFDDLEEDPRMLKIDRNRRNNGYEVSVQNSNAFNVDMTKFKRVGRWCDEVIVTDRYFLEGLNASLCVSPKAGSPIHVLCDAMTQMDALNENARQLKVRIYTSLKHSSSKGTLCDSIQKRIFSSQSEWERMEKAVRDALAECMGLSKRRKHCLAVCVYLARPGDTPPHPRLLGLKKGGCVPGFRIDGGFKIDLSCGAWVFTSDISRDIDIWHRGCVREVEA